MARGWESKSVESQIESAESGRADAERRSKSPDQIRREQERASLELTRRRLLHDLEAATHERHRPQLQAALGHIESKIAELDAETGAVPER